MIRDFACARTWVLGCLIGLFGVIGGLPITAYAQSKNVDKQNILPSIYLLLFDDSEQAVPPQVTTAPNISTQISHIVGTINEQINLWAPTNRGGRASHYSISPSLPAGLSFNTENGAISGTPTAFSSTKRYTVSAQNEIGSSSLQLRITINERAPDISETAPSQIVGSKGVAITPWQLANSGGQITQVKITPSLPAGLTFDTQTLTIEGTPLDLYATTVHTINVENSGGSDAFDLTITIHDSAPDLSGSDQNITGTANEPISAWLPNNSGGKVGTTYRISPAIGMGLVFDSDTGKISGTPTVNGSATHEVTASNPSGSSSIRVEIEIAKAPQAAFDAGGNVVATYGDAPFTQLATGGSGAGTITYSSSDTLVATVTSAGEVNIVGTGSAVITATKGEDAVYAATSDSYTLTVNKAAQAPLEAGDDVSKPYRGVSFTQVATGGSGSGQITYTVSNASVAVVNGRGTVYIKRVGTTQVIATKAGDDNYLAATDSYLLTVYPIEQDPLNAGNDVVKSIGDPAFTQAAQGGSGTGSITYTSSNTAVARVDANGKVTIIGTGTCTITATKAADSNYLEVSDSYTLNVLE